jgi:hypothetical protein
MSTENKPVLVTALRDGHDGIDYRPKGAQFYVHPDRLKDGSDWFAPAETAVIPPEPERPNVAGPKPGSRVPKQD